MARMVRAIGLNICLLVVVMDIIAGILGIEAQLAQNKEGFTKVSVFECREPSYKAYKLGLGATILLAVAHGIANTLVGCVCIFSREELQRSSPNKQTAAGSLILAWITLVVAFSSLILGTVSNARPPNTCGFSHQQALVIGGVICFVHGVFLVTYYVSASAVYEEEGMMMSQTRPSA